MSSSPLVHDSIAEAFGRLVVQRPDVVPEDVRHRVRVVTSARVLEAFLAAPGAPRVSPRAGVWPALAATCWCCSSSSRTEPLEAELWTFARWPGDGPGAPWLAVRAGTEGDGPGSTERIVRVVLERWKPGTRPGQAGRYVVEDASSSSSRS